MIAKLAVVGLAAAIGVSGWGLWAATRPYLVHAYFLSVERLVAGNQVTMGGVTVGQVAGVRLAPDTGAAGAIADLQIDGRYAPLRRGTRAVIRPEGPLGTMLVQLEPAGSGPPIPSGGTIPLQDTESPVSLDQVTDIFDPHTRQELQTLVRQGGVALQGRGQDLNQVLQQLPQISSNLAGTTAALDQETQQLDELQAEFDRVASMVAGEDTALRGDLGNGATVLNTLAQHQQGLQSLLTHADRSLGETNAALDGHQQDVRQVLQDLPSLLDQLRAFEDVSTTSFTIINPCMQNLLVLLDEMRSATSYRQPVGATDGAGFMLRVDPVLVGPSTGSFSPSASCSGGGG
ncbi:MAG TPA: MlaD family protein [Candidatus Dormibacteraeota bacterium]|nr:MlaD family protein [Candidatus Dormibacteraeota bacterium]